MSSFGLVSWNVANRVGEATCRHGEFLARLDPRPDVILLQEVNRRSVDTLCELAGMDWLHCAVDLRQPQPDDRPVRRRGVAIAGRTAAPASLQLLEDVPLPERLLIAALPLAGYVVDLASYPAPPGVSWFEKKPQQAVRFACWLATLTGPAAFGADANTPLIDAIDFQQTKTHWHTGRRILSGAPGDDLLVGRPSCIRCRTHYDAGWMSIPRSWTGCGPSVPVGRWRCRTGLAVASLIPAPTGGSTRSG